MSRGGQSTPFILPRYITLPLGKRKAASAIALPGSATDHLPFLDLLRGLAAQLIVWHHLAFYGPLSEAAEPLFPPLRESLIDYGRMAVQLFLVLAGFVTARSLAKRSQISWQDSLEIVQRRYVRIAGPYLVMLIFAITANLLAEQWMTHHSISALPTAPQFLAHAVLLHDILGYEAISAGIWYLAIDFQLGLLVLAFAMLSQQLARRTGRSSTFWMLMLVIPSSAASLFWFNGDDAWESWALYFFGSYAIGLVTAWVLMQRWPVWSLWFYAALMAAALVIEWRTRLAVSLLTGLAIFCAGRTGWLSTWPNVRWIGFAGATSYSLFLIHFPVCLVVNAWLSQFVLHSPALSFAGMLAAYGLSLLAAVAFHFGVERQFR